MNTEIRIGRVFRRHCRNPLLPEDIRNMARMAALLSDHPLPGGPSQVNQTPAKGITGEDERECSCPAELPNF